MPAGKQMRCQTDCDPERARLSQETQGTTAPRLRWTQATSSRVSATSDFYLFETGTLLSCFTPDELTCTHAVAGGRNAQCTRGKVPVYGSCSSAKELHAEGVKGRG